MAAAIIKKKWCNFLIPDAEVDLALYSVAAVAAGLDPQKSMMTGVIERFRSKYGGL